MSLINCKGFWNLILFWTKLKLPIWQLHEVPLSLVETRAWDNGDDELRELTNE